jgi:hypothetical protein
MDDDLLWTSDRPRWSGMYYHRERPGAASMLPSAGRGVAAQPAEGQAGAVAPIAAGAAS